jgi:hypothetical protein
MQQANMPSRPDSSFNNNNNTRRSRPLSAGAEDLDALKVQLREAEERVFDLVDRLDQADIGAQKARSTDGSQQSPPTEAADDLSTQLRVAARKVTSRGQGVGGRLDPSAVVARVREQEEQLVDKRDYDDASDYHGGDLQEEVGEWIQALRQQRLRKKAEAAS